jgi:carbon-monoxide dehydrogenase medium subunit
MLALGASVVLKSSTGVREVAIREFLVDAFQTSIAPGEMLTEIHVPARAPARVART